MTAKTPYNQDYCVSVGLTITDLRTLLTASLPLGLRAHLEDALDKATARETE